MALKHEVEELRQAADLLVAPLYSLEAERIPRHTLTEDEMPPDVAYQIVHDELMLDGNARLNVATFVSTWMEPQAEKLMAECLDKNMIDKDEYPQTAALETRCVNILANLWHAPDQDEATGCSTTGSSEAAMLAGLALKRRTSWCGNLRKSSSSPSSSITVKVEGCTVSPRKSRRKSPCFSSTSDVTPARASRKPSIMPAGPPPTMQHWVRVAVSRASPAGRGRSR